MAAEQPPLEVASAAAGLAAESAAAPLGAVVGWRLPSHARAQVRVHAPTRATDSLWAGVVAATEAVVAAGEDAQALATDLRAAAARQAAALAEEVSAVQRDALLGSELSEARELRQGSKHSQFPEPALRVPLV